MVDENTQAVLGAILTESAKHLLDRIRSGEVTAAELTVAMKLLKDNGINAIPTKSNGLGDLAESLPFQSLDEIEETHH